MQNSRRKFIINISLTAMVFSAGGFKLLSAADWHSSRAKIKSRFAILSDGHYGQEKTSYEESFQNIVESVSHVHKKQPLDFCFLNGDIIHNEKQFLMAAKTKLDDLPVPYYTAKGNHDMVSDAYWQQVWGTAPDHTVKEKGCSFIIANTSNEAGDYLSPNLNWLQQQLDANTSQQPVFLILHIPQTKWTANAIENPAFFELLKKYSNNKAVFHGHEHDQDGVKWKDEIPYFFDSHFGGSWGTAYHGFRVVEVLKDNSFITYIMNPANSINHFESNGALQ